MGLNRRTFMVGAISASATAFSPLALAQASKSVRKLVLGQSVPLSGAADQIGLAYFNGAKLYFDAVNSKNGAGGYRIEVKTLDDGYNAAKAAANVKQLIDEGVDACSGLRALPAVMLHLQPPKPPTPCFLRLLPHLTPCTSHRLPMFFTYGLHWLTRPTR